MVLNSIFLLLSSFFIQADTSDFPSNEDLLQYAHFKTMLVNIREENVSPDSAKSVFKSIIQHLRTKYPNHDELDTAMVFPLANSTISAVGGAGKGFYARTFNLFDHKVKGSHPAHDIFIYDPDQDCIDNRKKSYVDILSVGPGLVISIEDTWTPTSTFKGGNYVWVYDFIKGDLWYYAHLRKMNVQVGQKIETGQIIGQVGRTGSSAYAKRSDTHLHLAHFKLTDEFLPKAHNYYSWLKKSKFLKNGISVSF